MSVLKHGTSFFHPLMASFRYYLHYVDDSMESGGLNRVHVLEDYCALDPTNEWAKELLTTYQKDG